MKDKIDGFKVKYWDVFVKYLNEIKKIKMLIEESLLVFRELEEFNVVFFIMDYRLWNKEFSKFLFKVIVLMIIFYLKIINSD